MLGLSKCFSIVAKSNTGHQGSFPDDLLGLSYFAQVHQRITHSPERSVDAYACFTGYFFERIVLKIAQLYNFLLFERQQIN